MKHLIIDLDKNTVTESKKDCEGFEKCNKCGRYDLGVDDHEMILTARKVKDTLSEIDNKKALSIILGIATAYLLQCDPELKLKLLLRISDIVM